MNDKIKRSTFQQVQDMLEDDNISNSQMARDRNNAGMNRTSHFSHKLSSALESHHLRRTPLRVRVEDLIN